MNTNNLVIKKGSIFAYRVYDIAHEIDLKKAQELLNNQKLENKTYSLKKDPLKTISFKEPPLIVTGGSEMIELQIKSKKLSVNSFLEIKIWNYGVISISHKLNVADISWSDLVEIGAILDANSVVDQLSVKKKEEISQIIRNALKKPENHSIFEDYTTYLIEDLENHTKSKEKKEDGTFDVTIEKVSYPLEVLRTAGVAELLLAEPSKTLSELTHKSLQSNYTQYTKHDLLVMDWNSALVMDLGKEKESQDYIDIIEFSLGQLLELRIYDQKIDDKLDELYDSIEKKQYKKISEFYTKISEESGQLYLDFSDFFEKIDNSIKTVGDFYLAKVLKMADKKFGFDELKKSMSRKIDALSKLSEMYQEKVNSAIETQRNNTSHRLEWVVIILIAIEVLPFVYSKMPKIIALFNKITGYL